MSTAGRRADRLKCCAAVMSFPEQFSRLNCNPSQRKKPRSALSIRAWTPVWRWTCFPNYPNKSHGRFSCLDSRLASLWEAALNCNYLNAMLFHVADMYSTPLATSNEMCMSCVYNFVLYSFNISWFCLLQVSRPRAGHIGGAQCQPRGCDSFGSVLHLEKAMVQDAAA